MDQRSSIRVATRRRLIDLLNAADVIPAGIVRYGSPPEGCEFESIWIGDITGQREPAAALEARRVHRIDRFSLTIWIIAVGHGDPTGEEADERAELFASVIESLLADSPRLNDLPGLQSAVELGPSNGPNASPFADGTGALAGHVSLRTMTVACTSHAV